MTSTKNQLGGDGDELFERDTNDASFKKCKVHFHPVD